MKAQSAVLEAFIAAVILASAATYLATSAYTSSLAEGAADPSYGDMAFDLQMAAYGNSLVGGCISRLNQSCGAEILREFEAAYGVRYSALTVEGSSVGLGDRGACRYYRNSCFPAAYNGDVRLACLYVCGG